MQRNTISGVFICRLKPRVSKKGNSYFSGYCGQLNFAILKSNELSDGKPVWDLFVDGMHASPAASKAHKPKLGQTNETEEMSDEDEAPF